MKQRWATFCFWVAWAWIVLKFVVLGFLADLASAVGYPICADPRQGDPERSMGTQRLGNIVNDHCKRLGIDHRPVDGTAAGIRKLFEFVRNYRRGKRLEQRVRTLCEAHAGKPLAGDDLRYYLEALACELRRTK
jgi:hypothetical protein